MLVPPLSVRVVGGEEEEEDERGAKRRQGRDTWRRRQVLL